MVLTAEKINLVIAGALSKARELGLKPLGVAVVGTGGHLIGFLREAGASTVRAQIATAKASGALALGMSSRKIGDMATERPSFIAALGPITPGGIIPAAGGVIIVDEAGTPAAAVGVSGDTSDNDELCALAGIAAASLLAQA